MNKNRFIIFIYYTSIIATLSVFSSKLNGQFESNVLDTILIDKNFLVSTAPLSISSPTVSEHFYPFFTLDEVIQDTLRHHFYDQYNSAYRSKNASLVHTVLILKNNTSDRGNILLNYGNQRIHKILVFQSEDEDMHLLGITGKHLANLHNRTFRSNQLIIEVNLNPNQTIPLHIFHQTTVYSDKIDIQLWEREAYYSYIQFEHLAIGVYFGMILIMFIFVIYLGFIYQDRKFWFYGLYMLTVGLYVFQYMGYLDYMLLPSIYSYFIDLKIVLSSAAIIFLVYFFNAVLEFQKYTIRHGIRIIHICIIVVLILFFVSGYYREEHYWISKYAHYAANLSLATIGTILLIGLIRSSKKYPLESLVLLSSISARLIGYAIVIMVEVEILPRFDFPLSALEIVGLIELIAVTIYLAASARNISLKEQLALNKSSEAQLHLSQSLYQMRIDERDRIRQYLEEDILSLLELLKIQYSKYDKIYHDLIEDTNQRLLAIYSGLKNDSFSVIDLRVKCSELVKVYSSVDIEYKVEITLPNTLYPELLNNFYLIIRELFENARKHSKAKYVRVKLTDNLGVIELRYQDDGIGLSSSATNPGIGFFSIRKRVNDLKGQINILEQSAGLTIVIQVPT